MGRMRHGESLIGRKSGDVLIEGVLSSPRHIGRILVRVHHAESFAPRIPLHHKAPGDVSQNRWMAPVEVSPGFLP